MHSTFNELKKLSIAALSKQLPVLLMLQVTPANSSSFWKSKLPYWLPRSE